MAAAAVLGLQVTSGAERLPAYVTVSATGNGEIAVAENAPFLNGRRLRPAEVVDGHTELTNQTGERLRVRARAMGSARDIDESVTVILSMGDREFFRGPLSELRSWTRQPFFMRSVQADTLHVRSSLADDAKTYEGRVAELKLEFRSQPVEARR